jgi:hypothetical protein
VRRAGLPDLGGDLGLHGRDDSLGLRQVPGGLADLVDLGVSVGQGGRSRLDQHRDAELFEPRDQAIRILVGDNQVRGVLGDRLEVGGQAAQ